METKSCTNKFCLKKVLEGFDLLEYGDRGKRKDSEIMCLSSAQWNKRSISKLWKARDRAANYGYEIMSKTNLKELPEENVCP